MTYLQIENLSAARDGSLLLRAVNFVAGAGEFIGIVGPNGAGKTTLLRALAGLEKPAAGLVLLNAKPVAAMAPLERARALAYLPQTRDVHWAVTAEAVVSLGRFAYGAPHRLGPADRAAVEAALAATDCLSFRSRVASTLSGGELARVHLARALASETKMLVADEPTAALDLRHALSIIALLRGKADAGGLVIAALHDLDLARRYCTRLIVVNEGAIVADGAPSEAISETVLRQVFGVAFDASNGEFELST
ncbi:MAG: ABC transporter ATP-binding protein [Pseudomonadota bacterium]